MIGAYVLVDHDGDAVYVGASIDIARRVRQHRNADWWPLIADVWTFPADSKADAHRREIHLIHSLRPFRNKNHAGPIVCQCGCGADREVGAA